VVGGAETRRASLFFFAKKERKHICGSGAATTKKREGLPKRLGARSMFFSLFEGGRLELTRHNERNRLAPVSLYVVRARVTRSTRRRSHRRSASDVVRLFQEPWKNGARRSSSRRAPI